MKKRILSTLLALTMCLTLLPAAALATDTETEPETPTTGNVAEIERTGTAYATLAAAVVAAESGDTITLLDDCSGCGIGLFANAAENKCPVKTLIIDFATHTYTMNSGPVGSTGTESQAMHFEKGSDITLKNGTLKVANGYMGVQNYGNLTLVDFTLDASNYPDCGYVLSNNNSIVNITGGSSILASNGNYAFDVCVATSAYPDGVTVNIDTTGTITGKIHYDYWDTDEEGKQLENKTELNIKNGNFAGSFEFENDNLAEAAKTHFHVTGGKFNFDVSEYIADGYKVTEADGTWTVAKQSTSSSSSGGSSVTTKTEKNDDGSTTTTKTNKVTGTVTETTTYPDGSKTTVETNKDGSSETTTRLADGTTANIATDADGNTETEVTVTDKAITDAEGEPVVLPIPPVEEDNEVEIKLPKAAKVEIPAEDVTPGTVAVIVNDDGTEEVVKTSIATPDGVIVPLDGSATVKLIDNSKDFIDTTNHWAEDEIDFAASHEIFNGTSANTFSPNAAMTRGMIAVVLHNFENNPEAVYDGSFDDVTSDAWYAEGVEWAAAKGIVDGYDNGSFGAEDDITREQLVTILYRYAKASGLAADEQGSLDGFSDADSVSDYAAEAMRWAVGTGLIKGDNLGHLNAKAGATRAEVAAVMARFCVNLSK